eukprot:746570-Rhodomonas_salina.7
MLAVFFLLQGTTTTPPPHVRYHAMRWYSKPYGRIGLWQCYAVSGTESAWGAGTKWCTATSSSTCTTRPMMLGGSTGGTLY